MICIEDYTYDSQDSLVCKVIKVISHLNVPNITLAYNLWARVEKKQRNNLRQYIECHF